jgi:hypothetical protein
MASCVAPADRGIRIGCVQHRYEVMRCAGRQRPVPASACSRSREAALAVDRTQRPVAGRLHHGLGAISPADASPGDLVRRGAGGGHPRPLPARGRGRLRTDRRGSARRGAGFRRHPRRRWWQGVLGRWLWVVLSATTAVFHIGAEGPSVRKSTLRNRISPG